MATNLTNADGPDGSGIMIFLHFTSALQKLLVSGAEVCGMRIPSYQLRLRGWHLVMFGSV